MAKEAKKTTVAVVGSGLAGLVTAYLLRNDPQHRYHVTLLEKVRWRAIEAKFRYF
jgi:2-polyprenyl-6-methoxyphenol hydroxylase-like FAD-dependent oxidoreductase